MNPVDSLVFVLGDIGHSPRTLNTIKKLSETCSNVHVMAYKESSTFQLDHPSSDSPFQNVHMHILHEKCWEWTRMQPSSSGFKSSRLWFLIGSFFKVIIQWLLIWYILLFQVKVYSLNLIWCQVPPSIPTLVVLYLVRYIVLPLGYLCGMNQGDHRWVVDWHNLGYTLLRVAKRPKFMVYIAECIENFFGRRADVHLCVSNAFRLFLKDWANIDAVVLYDRPTNSFRDHDTIPMEERHELFVKLGWAIAGSNDHETLFTKRDKRTGNVQYLENRPALIVSSTSWTPDEDFALMLNAIEEYDVLHKNDSFPQLHFVITGKGPQKEFYLKKIAKMGLTKCVIETAWLEIEDYPRLLACADLGVCMHYSSSGIDLPMKVVDMFAAGLPVCAIGFNALNELVVHKGNGYIFQDSEELTRRIESVFENFPQDTSLLEGMRKNIQHTFQQVRWDDEWRAKVVRKGIMPSHKR
uniref:Chitobiosyldiphosphodolichol beta-mannosyltransferase n=1 Tax=Percolomonas cosmopolitus TaxID=63605 RepID=A0A7S1KPX8_9EUKA